MILFPPPAVKRRTCCFPPRADTCCYRGDVARPVTDRRYRPTGDLAGTRRGDRPARRLPMSASPITPFAVGPRTMNLNVPELLRLRCEEILDEAREIAERITRQ